MHEEFESDLHRAVIDKLVDDVGDIYIDQYHLARTIVESIEDQCGVPATKDLCHQVWIQVLSTLRTEIDSAARCLAIDYSDDAVPAAGV